MKVLVVGGGGREHALCMRLQSSPSVSHVYCAPGNGGIEQSGAAGCLTDIVASNFERLAKFAKDESIDLTVVGPEAPLVAGIVDYFREEGLRIYGPDKRGAQLEGSKEFAKSLFERNNIPTASYRVFTEFAEAKAYVEAHEFFPVVVKADGIAAGKGVLICETREQALEGLAEIMVERRFGEAGDKVVVEEFLRGEEASVHAVTDGETLVVLPTSQDHKRIGDNDTGPNTGGMGAYSPAPVVEGALLDKVIKTILVPTMHGLRQDGIDYRGTLYAGLMITRGGPRILEYNVRFGDPETQVILPRITSDFGELLFAAADKKLADYGTIEESPDACVGIVLASEGYPGKYHAGKPISGLDTAGAMPGVAVCHAGTSQRDGRLVTAGGRVLCVTATGPGIAEAREAAYAGVKQIDFEGAYYRTDIANRALSRA
ncbi:MAG: phosphoribosylamine--glycine ligase [Planctomycetota bacterium]|nr:phosphoribosylamine--glycine ligase [Planctomycetota bacterium]